MGCTLQANRKDKESATHVDRDCQFRYISDTAKRFLKAKEPVISVDTKKKEKVGNFKSNGRKWHKKGEAPKVNVHDFPSLADGTAIPYGASDVLPKRRNGERRTHDTAEFAVASIRRWWLQFGIRHYAAARRQFICADSGGSNAARNRAWKYHLQQLSDETGLEVVVGHYPPGTSKWNKIEHRMFSFLSFELERRTALVSFETVVNMISATTTKQGLRIQAMLDPASYETGVKITDAQMKQLNLRPHGRNPEWNYSLLPHNPHPKTFLMVNVILRQALSIPLPQELRHSFVFREQLRQRSSESHTWTAGRISESNERQPCATRDGRDGFAMAGA